MSARTFKATHNRLPITASAFGQPDAFVSLRIGEPTVGMYALFLSPQEARSLAMELEAAATHAENVLRTGLGESAVAA